MDATPGDVTIGSVGAAMPSHSSGAAFRLGAGLGTLQEHVEAIPNHRQDGQALAGRVGGLTE